MAALVALFLFTTVRAVAAPPEGSDPDSNTAQWYRSLKSPDGIGCCSESDCRAYSDEKVRIRDGAYQVFIQGEWRTVPSEKILLHEPNPTGEAVACWLQSVGFLCFVRPTET